MLRKSSQFFHNLSLRDQSTKKQDTESIDEPGKIVYDLPYQFSPVQGGTVRKNNIS